MSWQKPKVYFFIYNIIARANATVLSLLKPKGNKKNRSKYHLLVKIFIFTWPKEEKSNAKSKKNQNKLLICSFRLKTTKAMII